MCTSCSWSLLPSLLFGSTMFQSPKNKSTSGYLVANAYNTDSMFGCIVLSEDVHVMYLPCECRRPRFKAAGKPTFFSASTMVIEGNSFCWRSSNISSVLSVEPSLMQMISIRDHGGRCWCSGTGVMVCAIALAIDSWRYSCDAPLYTGIKMVTSGCVVWSSETITCAAFVACSTHWSVCLCRARVMPLGSSPHGLCDWNGLSKSSCVNRPCNGGSVLLLCGEYTGNWHTVWHALPQR